MKVQGKKLVVLAHDASLSGAPVLLLNLLLLLKESADITVSVVAFQRPGPLLPEFSQYFKVILLKPEGYATEGNLFKRLAGILRNRTRLGKLILSTINADIVFSNTVVNGKLVKLLSVFNKSTVTYVHELKDVLDFYARTGETTAAIRYSKVLAYPSLKVKQVLQELYGVPEQKLAKLPYFLPADRQLLNDAAARDKFVQQFRSKIGLPDSGLLIVGMGKISHRKGTDIFVNICERVRRENSDIHFCWIGDAENQESENAIQRLIDEKHLAGQIIFTGALPYNYFNLAAFDVFLLSSREDPYPLVVLEAALMGVPAICFGDSGGISEFVGNDGGWVIPGFDTDKAVKIILGLHSQKNLCSEKGHLAKQKALREHVNRDVVLNYFNEILNQYN